MRLSVFKRAFKKDVAIIRVSFVVGVFVFIGLFFDFTVKKYKESADYIKEKFEKRDSIIKSAINSDTTNLAAKGKLKEQFNTIAEIKKSYIFMAHRFNSYGYSFTMFFTFFSIISGVLGFLLIKKGWDNVDNFYLKSAFLITFFCSTLFGVLPSVFNTKDNTKSNLAKYNYFSGLQLDIYDLVRDNRGYIKRSTSGSLDTLNKEIYSITRGIKENQDLYFDTNIDKVPTKIDPLK